MNCGTATAGSSAARQWWHLTLTGQVQGVGFRPFVYHLASRMGLSGRVSNDAEGVQIDLCCTSEELEKFQQALWLEQPPMAVVEEMECRAVEQQSPLQTVQGDGQSASFEIVASGAGEVKVAVTPDAAVCSDCLRELFDPVDRRYRYPFINCTNCGPRYTLIKQLPYDRPNTTMAPFRLCTPCLAEYQSPKDRRFHAQPNACASCGPQLSVHDQHGQLLEVADPIAETLTRLKRGEIVAIKGVGGFHLVCDARNAQSVASLRIRKQREEKPFAVMGANTASLRAVVTLTPATEARLQALDAPIVVCPVLAPELLPGIAPDLSWFGVMLPHTPLHYLLFHEAAGRPVGMHWLQEAQDFLLVMTSANPSGEPLVTANEAAFERLKGIADAYLVHDREIHTRCDDSVLHGAGEAPALIRRGRGLAPQVIRLPASGPSVLACGAFFKNTICLTKGDRAYVSQHIGDLDNAACCRSLEEMVARLQALLEIDPEIVACDLHPDFYSSRFAQQVAGERGLPLVAVQHHHAHIAAVLAESDIEEPVLGLALDGLGLGDDGGLWGGELFRVDAHRFERLGHLCTLPLPGGDRAAKEPWRMAAGVLHHLGEGQRIAQRFAEFPGASTIAQMLERRLNCPETSSAGRLFDAAAGILGIKPVAAYEAQPAMILEGLAARYGKTPDEPLHLVCRENGLLDTLPLLARLFDIDDSEYGAALFHAQLIEGLAEWVLRQREATGIERVAMAGGCFLNQRLTTGLVQRLEAQGMQVLRPRQLPCNDGGVSLGQAWVAINQTKHKAVGKL